jgi:hypothetical protein
MRKYIIPGSVRIYGLPGTDNNVGIRDNGSGQMWSETRKVGSINYWTGEVVLAKEHVPKVRFWHELQLLVGLKSAESNVTCEYQVSNLESETVTEQPPSLLSLTDLSLTGRRRKR